jgi:hypothetical protein
MMIMRTNLYTGQKKRKKRRNPPASGQKLGHHLPLRSAAALALNPLVRIAALNSSLRSHRPAKARIKDDQSSCRLAVSFFSANHRVVCVEDLVVGQTSKRKEKPKDSRTRDDLNA